MRPMPSTFIGIPFHNYRSCVFSEVYFWLSALAFLFAGCFVASYGLHVLRHYGLH